jgi:dTDP-4-amino-4,6-dideoxygalactose transaminase
MINVTMTDLPDIKKYIKYLEKIWSNRWVTNNGEFVQLLERKLEEYFDLDEKSLLLVANGTLALQLALKCLDINGNNENRRDVITTPFTFAATTNAIIWEGLNPVFVDIDSETYNIDYRNIENKITDKTTAILGVHIFGNPCYVEKIQEIADKYNLKVIYDAAHAFGVKYKYDSILRYGDISTLSFHATKVFNTIEGGAIIVNSNGKNKEKNNELYEKLKLLRNFGIVSEERVALPGINAKMNEFQASMGLCNLENIDERISFRKIIYEYYQKHLKSNNNIRFQKIIASKYNYSYMPICFADKEQRDLIYSELIKNGIKPRKYFYPLTANFDYFDNDKNNNKHEIMSASCISNKILCLPIYFDLRMDDVNKIIYVIDGTLL